MIVGECLWSLCWIAWFCTGGWLTTECSYDGGTDIAAGDRSTYGGAANVSSLPALQVSSVAGAVGEIIVAHLAGMPLCAIFLLLPLHIRLKHNRTPPKPL